MLSLPEAPIYNTAEATAISQDSIYHLVLIEAIGDEAILLLPHERMCSFQSYLIKHYVVIM